MGGRRPYGASFDHRHRDTHATDKEEFVVVSHPPPAAAADPGAGDKASHVLDKKTPDAPNVVGEVQRVHADLTSLASEVKAISLKLFSAAPSKKPAASDEPAAADVAENGVAENGVVENGGGVPQDVADRLWGIEKAVNQLLLTTQFHERQIELIREVHMEELTRPRERELELVRKMGELEKIVGWVRTRQDEAAVGAANLELRLAAAEARAVAAEAASAAASSSSRGLQSQNAKLHMQVKALQERFDASDREQDRRQGRADTAQREMVERILGVERTVEKSLGDRSGTSDMHRLDGAIRTLTKKQDSAQTLQAKVEKATQEAALLQQQAVERVRAIRSTEPVPLLARALMAAPTALGELEDLRGAERSSWRGRPARGSSLE